MYITITKEEKDILAIIIFSTILLAYILAKILDKRVSDRFKIIYIKVSLSIGMFIFFLICVCCIYLYNHDLESYHLFGDIGAAFCVAASSFGIFMMLFGSVKPTKPEKYLLKQSNYEDFSRYLKDRITLFEYQNKYNEENLKVYRKEIKKKIYYIFDVRLDELTEDNFNELYENIIFPKIEEDFNRMQYKNYLLHVTIVISVNRITPMFNTFINSEDRDKRYLKFPVGVSFGGNKLYLGGVDDFERQPCKVLRKEFKKIVEIEEEK